MLKKLGCAIASLCLIVWPLISNAKDYDLQPSSKWLMDYAPDSCLLARTFGEGDQAIMLHLTRFAPQDEFSVTLIGQLIPRIDMWTLVHLRFGNTGPLVDRYPTPADANGVPTLITTMRLDNLQTEERTSKQLPQVSGSTEADVSELTIKHRERAIVLRLGSMAQPMAAMRKCTDDLLKEWGLDPAEQAALASSPVPLRRDAWVSWFDYPMASAIKGQGAVINLRLMVDASGLPTKCSLQFSTAADPMFVKNSCNSLLQRARFRPAKTKDGRSIPSYFVERIRFVAHDR